MKTRLLLFAFLESITYFIMLFLNLFFDYNHFTFNPIYWQKELIFIKIIFISITFLNILFSIAPSEEEIKEGFLKIKKKFY